MVAAKFAYYSFGLDADAFVVCACVEIVELQHVGIAFYATFQMYGAFELGKCWRKRSGNVLQVDRG